MAFKRKPTIPAEHVTTTTTTTTAVHPVMQGFDTLPDSAYIRLASLVQHPKHPDNNAPLPFSMPTLWRKVKNGTFPKPCKLSAGITAWKVGEVRQWLAAQASA